MPEYKNKTTAAAAASNKNNLLCELHLTIGSRCEFVCVLTHTHTHTHNHKHLPTN